MDDGNLTVGLFGGAKSGNQKSFRDGAIALGEFLAEEGLTLVFGGEFQGLMGLVAKASLALGGQVHGVVTRQLYQPKEVLEPTYTLEIVEALPERKAKMEARSDLFIVLPGGFGTLDELTEIVTLRQLGLHSKPILVFNLGGYYDHLFAFLRQAVKDELVTPSDSKILIDCRTVSDIGRCLSREGLLGSPKARIRATDGESKDSSLA